MQWSSWSNGCVNAITKQMKFSMHESHNILSFIIKIIVHLYNILYINIIYLVVPYMWPNEICYIYIYIQRVSIPSQNSITQYNKYNNQFSALSRSS